MSTRFKEILIYGLKEELETAKRTDVLEIASKIRAIGFSCNMCGKCCRRAYGDNTVAVSPGEIESIYKLTGLDHSRVAVPLTDKTGVMPERRYLEEHRDMIDKEGNIHTFGWRLSCKKNGDCGFIQDRGTGNRCSIYDARPWLCSTYPFYLEDGSLKVSECEGLGQSISAEDSLRLAKKVIARYIAEAEEAILLYEKYEGFEQGPENVNKALENILEGIINYIVHDSRGSHRASVKTAIID